MRPGRTLLSALVLAGTALLALPSLSSGAAAQEASTLTGLWLTTDYPERSAEFGEDIRIDLDLVNRNLPPERVALSVEGLPAGWEAEIVGSGTQVSAAMVGTDKDLALTLKLTPPEKAEPGSYSFEVVGASANRTMRLPMTLDLAEPKPAKLTFEPKLPNLRGTAKSSFDFELNLKNESLEDTVVNLAAVAPSGFEVSANTKTPRPNVAATSSMGRKEPKPRYGLAVTASAHNGDAGSR